MLHHNVSGKRPLPNNNTTTVFCKGQVIQVLVRAFFGRSQPARRKCVSLAVAHAATVKRGQNKVRIAAELK
ncbi:MAG: hypothetical protein MUO33_02195 [Sedimentisphaerales bacterium]|nr:hypothetical protein [Sedimentisphaerales bacterium]